MPLLLNMAKKRREAVTRLGTAHPPRWIGIRNCEILPLKMFKVVKFEEVVGSPASLRRDIFSQLGG